MNRTCRTCGHSEWDHSGYGGCCRCPCSGDFGPDPGPVSYEGPQVPVRSLAPGTPAVAHVPTKRTMRPANREFRLSEASVTIHDDNGRNAGVRATLSPSTTPMHGWSPDRETGAPAALRELARKLAQWGKELEQLADEEERFGC